MNARWKTNARAPAAQRRCVSWTANQMGSTSASGHTHKGLSLSRGLFLAFGYFIGSSVLGLAIGFATILALYRGVVEWRRPAVAAALSLAVIALCWLTMPANRPHM